MTEPSRITRIRERLTDALAPERLEIIDESHKHVGHEGAKYGGGHYRVLIVSTAFSDKNLLQRHRLVYDTLREAMQDDIHALSIRALTPDET
jgi:BolA protein